MDRTGSRMGPSGAPSRGPTAKGRHLVEAVPKQGIPFSSSPTSSLSRTYTPDKPFKSAPSSFMRRDDRARLRPRRCLREFSRDSVTECWKVVRLAARDQGRRALSANLNLLVDPMTAGVVDVSS
jgi:hypothetical protein